MACELIGRRLANVPGLWNSEDGTIGLRIDSSQQGKGSTGKRGGERKKKVATK